MSIYLLDGHALAYRAYFALTAGSGADRWRTSKGEPVAGIYGFASILMRLLDKEKPAHIAIAFDTGKTFRNDLYAGYKATRAKMPDDLRPQIDRIRELTDIFGFPRLEMEGYEADDVLGSTAQIAVKDGYDVKIVTGDKDLLQLVTDKILVELSGNKLSETKEYDVQTVKQYLGILPEQVVDYKALVGDPSDNYPGVPGIGPKTAVTLLNQYGTLDSIYEHLSEIKESIAQKLKANKESAYLSRELAKIRTDLSLDINLALGATDRIDFPAVEKFFKELEFKSLIPKLRTLAPTFQPIQDQLSLFGLSNADDEQPESAHEARCHIIDSEQDLIRMIEKTSQANSLSLDTETTGTDPMDCHLVGISLSIETGMGYYIPVGHLTGEPQLDLEKVRQSLNPLFLREDIVKVGHNIKYDLIVLRNHGFEVKGKLFDTMVAGWVIDPESKNLGLKAMAFDLLGINMQSIDTLIGKGSNQLTMANVSIKDAAPYAAADADMTLRLVPILKETLKKRETEKIFDELEMPLIPVLTDMEMAGIRVDRDFLKEMSKSLEIRLSEIEKDIYAGVGYEFNINSTQQLSRAIFETLKLEPPGRKKKTTSGLYSTSADVLEEMRGSHPIIDLILEHRELSKLKNTYVDALPLTINRRTGRVHTSFNQTGAVTGRLASSSPNLQNIPTRTELGRKVRTAFIADPDHVLLSVDYSQIELRIVAHMAQDEGMLAAFRAGQDIHATTAAAIYGCDISQVTKEMRRHAKAINFGLIYGMSPYGLSQSANLSRKEAEEFVDAYFKKFPRIKEYLDSIKIQAAEKGYVETMMGRKRYFPNLGQQKNYSLRTREEREAINAPIQGTAADIMKLAMIQVHDKLKKSVLQAQILLQVHDELLLECSQKDLDETRELVQDTMENVVTLSIPLLTEARSGLNWGDLTPMP